MAAIKLKTGSTLPENFRRIWDASDELIGWAESKILETPHLCEHLSLIETYMSGVEFLRKSGLASQRHTALAGLFLRTFDALSHGVRAAMSGNYSGGAMYARDLLETTFLIDFLLEAQGRPEKWLQAKPEQVKRDYSPRKIRDHLDKRDGYTTLKRKSHYDMLSTLGAHPTPAAFELKRDGTRAINAGPFKHEDLLREVLEEFSKISLQLTSLVLKYLGELDGNDLPRSVLSLTLQKNYELYFKAPGSANP